MAIALSYRPGVSSAGAGPGQAYAQGVGILSWFRSLRSPDLPDDESPSLLRRRYEDPDFEPVEEAAAADVAAVEQDDKYFGSDAPANQDEL